MNPEDLGQPRDPEDLEYPLRRADQVQRPVVRADSLEPADKHAEAGRVEKLHLLHVHDDLVITAGYQINKHLAETRSRVDVDLALHVDDLDAVLGVVIQLQI